MVHRVVSARGCACSAPLPTRAFAPQGGHLLSVGPLPSPSSPCLHPHPHPRLHRALRQALSSAVGLRTGSGQGGSAQQGPRNSQAGLSTGENHSHGEGRVASPGTKSSMLSPCSLTSSAPMEIDRFCFFFCHHFSIFFFFGQFLLLCVTIPQTMQIFYSKRIMCDNVHNNDALRRQK